MPAARRRLGVALLLDPPISDQVDGLRRGLGDPSLDRVPSHLTLVPPVNIRADQLSAALGVLRRAAAGQPGPLRLTLGRLATFQPDNPVLYLEVGGDLPRLQTLRDAAFAPPLERSLSWPWVPHVTVADTATEDRIAAALTALDRFAVVTWVEYVTLLQEDRGRLWRPIADVALGAPTVVGRGGLPLEITRSRLLDPESHELLRAVWPAAGDAGDAAETGWAPSFPPIVLSARREGQVVGVGLAWRSEAGGRVAVLVLPSARGQGIGATLLAHLEAAVRQAGWECPVLHAHGPAGFYRVRSSWATPVAPTRTAPPRTGPAS